MSWRFLLFPIFAVAYLFWIWRGVKAYRRVGIILALAGSAGILIMLACDIIKTLPSHAPLRTVTGLAGSRRSGFFRRSHSDFILTEAGTDRRFLFTTVIDGPWDNQPITATYVDDGRFTPSVVRIEILGGAQFPWQVQSGHAGWVGTTEVKRRPPPMLDLLGIVFLLVGVFAPEMRKKSAGEGA